MPGWELIDNKKRAINNLFKFPKVGIKNQFFITILK